MSRKKSAFKTIFILMLIGLGAILVWQRTMIFKMLFVSVPQEEVSEEIIDTTLYPFEFARLPIPTKSEILKEEVNEDKTKTEIQLAYPAATEKLISYYKDSLPLQGWTMDTEYELNGGVVIPVIQGNFSEGLLTVVPSGKDSSLVIFKLTKK